MMKIDDGWWWNAAESVDDFAVAVAAYGNRPHYLECVGGFAKGVASTRNTAPRFWGAE
jgi:hypothetical protein